MVMIRQQLRDEAAKHTQLNQFQLYSKLCDFATRLGEGIDVSEVFAGGNGRSNSLSVDGGNLVNSHVTTESDAIISLVLLNRDSIVISERFAASCCMQLKAFLSVDFQWQMYKHLFTALEKLLICPQVMNTLYEVAASQSKITIVQSLFLHLYLLIVTKNSGHQDYSIDIEPVQVLNYCKKAILYSPSDNQNVQHYLEFQYNCGQVGVLQRDFPLARQMFKYVLDIVPSQQLQQQHQQMMDNGGHEGGKSARMNLRMSDSNTVLSKIKLEAFKKYLLLSLILDGEYPSRRTFSQQPRCSKYIIYHQMASGYWVLAQAYECSSLSQYDNIVKIIHQDAGSKQSYQADGNYSLVLMCQDVFKAHYVRTQIASVYSDITLVRLRKMLGIPSDNGNPQADEELNRIVRVLTKQFGYSTRQMHLVLQNDSSIMDDRQAAVNGHSQLNQYIDALKQKNGAILQDEVYWKRVIAQSKAGQQKTVPKLPKPLKQSQQSFSAVLGSSSNNNSKGKGRQWYGPEDRDSGFGGFNAGFLQQQMT
ncbi:hypothetical protein MIR68_000999 [Amoeboaphelidium protococcarum]|nr:hypothetical protein MIR68_000999 [Amoeboaphelidium protococcarum]